MKRLGLLLIFILSIELASAAILHGAIYDTNLNKLNDVVVEVNSTSPQVFVSKEGQYSFVLEPGTYIVTAKYHVGSTSFLYTQENITIFRDSIIKKDLLLKPTKRQDAITGVIIGTSGAISYTMLISVISVVLLISLGYTVYRLKFAPTLSEDQGFDQYTNDLLKAVKEGGGRTTQKDIRKKIPLSEAKVSLMITELENKGILKRIKKGRGNVIILEKK